MFSMLYICLYSSKVEQNTVNICISVRFTLKASIGYFFLLIIRYLLGLSVHIFVGLFLNYYTYPKFKKNKQWIIK